MRRSVDHTAMRAAGYFSALGVDAGGSASFHLSSVDSDIETRIVRLDRTQEPESTDWPTTTGAAPRIQGFDLGSSLAIRLPERLLKAAAWALSFEFRLAAAPAGRVLVGGAGFTVRFDTGGALILRGPESATGQILPVGTWLHARLCMGRDALSFRVDQAGAEIAALSIGCCAVGPGILRLGADLEGRVPTLNVGVGRIALRDANEAVVAAWQFPAAGRPRQLAPIEGEGVLDIHNAPSFGMRSARWDGSVLDPRLQAEHYDAVTLHDDDLADAQWPETHRVSIPEDAACGVYAIEVTSGAETRRWPFFVTAKVRQANLVFLVPTFTYLAYANERLPPERFPWLCDDAGHRFAKANDLTSLYDTHNDGSGVSLASFRRPLATLRDDYRYPLCDAPHLLPVDLHLLRFLHAQDIQVDLLTDADLHRDTARLRAYRGLVTGSHPEYWTGAMRAALDGFRDRGGHIAYLGGNGGYWVTACDGDTIEVRRGLSGIRTWNSEPGESNLATTGEPGGLWRHRDRAEHRLLGVGLQAMGFSRAQPFRRTLASYAADLAWLFAGVGDAPIGADGLVLDGAAGYEIDARASRWKSPAEARVLAVADGFDAGYVVDSDATEDGLPAPARAEMTLTKCASGALVFAASSVAWCGALPQRGAMNAVGCLTANLLRRMAR